MLKNIKLILQYDGSEFAGWQKLKGQEKQKTIQGLLEDTLAEILSGPIHVIGSGRTDQGVHALGQTANFHTKTKISIEMIQQKLNEKLPGAIRATSVSKEETSFHSRYKAISKTYEYRIDTGEKQCVFTRKYTLHHPDPIDIGKMKKAAQHFIGVHDFKAFSTAGKANINTIREIFDIEIITQKKEILIQIKGNGFLYNMVRIMVGTLIEVGEGKRDGSEVKEILESLDRKKAGITAEYQGLTLKEVEYP